MPKKFSSPGRPTGAKSDVVGYDINSIPPICKLKPLAYTLGYSYARLKLASRNIPEFPKPIDADIRITNSTPLFYRTAEVLAFLGIASAKPVSVEQAAA